ncbi:carboxymuconolactone decarboxylase family protein [Dactylosporangium aurantiacum]|uniref:Carboxymuconolactone decarboxylase family protein n=2 Tax=Dactylosporangium aurantiacum TaxID=35754 RepID=A0A9Q9MKI9_9ACTN|nr:carboxymuconolactone decarboxylase family protein [Dactylosporangium aurantiacum]
MSTERMPDPATLVPGAADALAALERAVAAAGVDGRLLALSQLRASQLNGCGPGVAGGADRARLHGATPRQVDAVAAWRQTPWFSDEERAVLALTEAVTRLADRPDPVPDQVWDLAAKHFDRSELAVLLLGIAVTNTLNRLDVPTRQQAGS